ncbi:SOS-response repressor and protease LexA [Candidatus Hydrogenisulfobacillus filiaventi]|uniref:SOS-response repressor and protease LexA n=1 Tax=Candidatus Hydrogenisulfobacillus filiaventi TaxID=2707344 RepID=A0A6F8ZIG6_9FIRM|nr:SOS-response repressor and protease LexA [Candidatus Hydrogenisulfobacillus filiaventi]
MRKVTPQQRKRIGRRIRRLREQRGWSQTAVAGMLGVQQRTISNYECGNRLPAVPLMHRLAEILNVPITDLTSPEPWEDEPPLEGDEATEAEEPTVETAEAKRRRALTTSPWNWLSIATAVRSQRLWRRWTTAKLAERVGVDVAVVEAMESGDPVPLDLLRRVADELGLGLASLLATARKDREPAVVEGGVPVRSVPVLGRVVAGVPMEAQPDKIGMAWVPSALRADFALEVRGDSMIGAHIFPGDWVIVRKVDAWQDVEDGRMVVAATNGGETTLKYLIREPDPAGDRWWLRAANPAYPDRPLDPEQDRVLGVVVQIQSTRPPESPAVAASRAAIAPLPAQDLDPLEGLTPEQRAAVLALIAQLRSANRDHEKKQPGSDEVD